MSAGRRNETLFALLERNVRLPVRLLGDLRAQLAACHIAERGVRDLVGALRRRGVRALHVDGRCSTTPSG